MRRVAINITIYALFLSAICLGAEGRGNADACMLAMDPSVGKWIARVDPQGLAVKQFPPGSAIKPFTLIATIESGAGTSMVWRCEPSSPETPVRDSCWYRPGHGTVDMEKALALSCDRYFRELARQVRWPVFIDTLARFGLIDAASRADLEAMDASERIDVMTGLSTALRVSPQNLLLAYAAVFNGGYLFQGGDYDRMRIKRRIKVNPISVRILTKGLLGATGYGTASAIGRAFPKREILSKTGTATYTENGAIDHNRTHAWYVGITPATAPRAAIVIFIPTGQGAHDAVPAAIPFWERVLSHESYYHSER